MAQPNLQIEILRFAQNDSLGNPWTPCFHPGEAKDGP